MTKKNKRVWLTLPLLIIIGALFLQSLPLKTTNQSSNGNDVYWPTRTELQRKFRDIRKVLLVYGTGNPEAVEKYRIYAEKRAGDNRWIETIIKPDSAVTSEDIKSLPLSLIGTPSSNSLLRKIQNSLPMNVKDGVLSVVRLLTLEETDVYILSMFPNPLQPSLFVSVTTANTDAAILRYLKRANQSYFQIGEFFIDRNGEGIVLGFFKQEGGKPWEIDYENTRNYLAGTDLVKESEHYNFIYHGDKKPDQEIKNLAITQNKNFSALLNKLQDAGMDVSDAPRIEYHLYETLEDKGLIAGNTDLSHHNFDRNQVHVIFNEDMRGDNFYSDAHLLISKLVGETKSRAMRDGFAMYFSEGWGKHGYQFWAKKFYDTGNVNPLSEILDDKIYRRESYLFMRPLSGSFVEFLIREFGWVKFLELYKNWPESGLPQQLAATNLAELERGWLGYLSSVNVETSGQISNNISKSPKFQKGFCYAHEGYQIYNGYLSQKSFQSLKKLNSLGNEWISITPFGYLRNPKEPSYFRYSLGAGSENDESVIMAMYHAKKLGMNVMLKPHILLSGPHWGWPGDVKMQNNADWQRFFKYYTSWIRHYALLAEIYGMDIFCIGVELLNTTTEHPDEWREIIRKVRQIYNGQIVYAANWGQEFEQITFWDDLDYIGLNCYYPLSKKDLVTVDELKKGTEKFISRIEKVARQYNKPVLLTEVGFTSTAKNWQNPHERNRSAQAYFEDQALCYQAMFESFWDKDWFYGFYWWKWPTYLEYGGRHHSGFTPNGKPAEKVVKEWYSKIPAAR